MRADDPALPGEREAPTLVGGAYIQFVRFQGTELADTIRNQQEIRGPLPDLIHRIDQLLEANIEVATSITERSVEIRRPDYPLMALQQLVRNAVLHRSYEGTNAPVRCYWYDDRIEISSPGGPYGQVTAENFGQPAAADYRNRYLAEAMRVLEFVQRFGPEVELAGLAEGVDFAEAGEAAGLVGGEGGCLEQPQDDLEPCLDQVVGGRQLELYRQLPGGARPAAVRSEVRRDGPVAQTADHHPGPAKIAAPAPDRDLPVARLIPGNELRSRCPRQALSIGQAAASRRRSACGRVASRGSSSRDAQPRASA